MIDEDDIMRVAELVSRLSLAQQRLVDAVAEGFRAGWLDPGHWERSWRGSDLSDEWTCSQALTWLARRKRASGVSSLSYPRD